MKAQGWVAWAVLVFVPVAMATPPAWHVTGDGAHYALEGGGDVASDPGASLTVRSLPGAATGFGGGLLVIDAAPFRGRRVQLSGRLGARDVVGGAKLWLRADGAAGVLAFKNSDDEPVAGNADDIPRMVEIDVPASADRLLLGPLLSGTGRMTVTGLRLRRLPSRPGDGVPPAQIVNEAVRLIRLHALNADRVDWTRVQAELAQEMPQLRTPDAAYGVIRSLLRKLQDRHSELLPPREVQHHSDEGTPSFVPVVEVHDAVGIVPVPAFDGTDTAAGEAFARDLASAIAAQASEAPCGWVVDLRNNNGGNMWPMLSGLYPLLGDATPGYVRDRAGRQRVWKMVSPGIAGPDLSAVPVVVVTGAKTASSGEAVAVAFRGRPQTRSVGQPTFGVSTSNQMYALPGGAGLNLTTARFVDRTGRAYGDALVPDETVPEPEAVAHAVALLADCSR